MKRTKNNLVNCVKRELAKRPTHEEVAEALAILEKYQKVWLNIRHIFNTREVQIKQYFVIRDLLEILGITFTDAVVPQAVDTKQFNLEWQGDRTAALFWSSGCGWSIDARKFGKKLGKIWEEFDFDSTLADNDIDLDGDDFYPD